jgi:hypothetical protein
MENLVLLQLSGALVRNHSITFVLPGVDFAGGYLHVPDIVELAFSQVAGKDAGIAVFSFRLICCIFQRA